MKKKARNNTKISDRVIKNTNGSMGDYGYDFSPSLASAPNQDEQLVRKEKLETIARKKE